MSNVHDLVVVVSCRVHWVPPPLPCAAENILEGVSEGDCVKDKRGVVEASTAWRKQHFCHVAVKM